MDSGCPCGSGQDYGSCCGQYITGQSVAPTPEALMRSRYTAYTKADIAYIERTMKEQALRHFSFEDSMQWANEAQWLRLDVLSSDALSQHEGRVEFKAHYTLSGIEKCLHERSVFKRIDGRWYYVGNEKFRMVDAGQKREKVGRNDPCPCNSGKKYKKCCYNHSDH